MTRNKISLLLALCLSLAAIFLYWETLYYDFVFFDDVKILLQQDQLFGQSTFLDNFQAIIFSGFPREEPLLVRDISWLFDSRIFGFGNAFGYHYFNVLYHGVVIGCAFAFLFMLTGQYIPALVAVAIYSVLAVHVEPVSWIMGRKDILANLSLLLLLICEIKYQRSTKTLSRIALYSLTLVFVVIACLSKISAIVYPIVVLLLKVFLPSFDKSSHRPKIGYAALEVVPHIVASYLVYHWYQGVLRDFGAFENAQSFSSYDYIVIFSVVNPLVFLRYLKLLTIPDSLSVQYPWNGLYAEISWLHGFIAVGIVLTAVGIGIILLKRRRDLLFFYLCFFVLMLPYANIVNYGWWYANRYLYASSLFLITPVVLVWYDNRKTMIGWLLASILVVVSGINLYANLQHHAVWKNARSFWSHEVDLSRTDYRIREARIEYYIDKAIDSSVNEADYWINMAEREIQQTLLKYWPDTAVRPGKYLYSTFYFQGVLRRRLGWSVESQLEAFKIAVALNPGYADVHRMLAVIYNDLACEAITYTDRERYTLKSLEHNDRFLALTK